MITPIFSVEVTEARRNGVPVVALESTIVTHGMPYPDNVDTARLVEDDIRKEGACPATIAVIAGQLHVGLSSAEIEQLAQAQDVAKLSRADLAVALSAGWTGSTTVAATMIAARLADIEVFATGGIGGVHRGADQSFDISADLQELAQTPVNVVAAGAKAILDLPKTLEVLETLGVPVIAYQQDDFPAFWSSRSGLKAPLRLDSPGEIARGFRMRAALGLPGGQLIANPVPWRDEIAQAELAPVIETAVADAEAMGITAKGVTPFILQRIFDLTGGKSLRTNVALVRNNARLAAQIATELKLSEQKARSG